MEMPAIIAAIVIVTDTKGLSPTCTHLIYEMRVSFLAVSKVESEI